MDNRGRLSDVIAVSREATYALMDGYPCTNCEGKTFAMYEAAKRSVMVSCRKCKHFENTSKTDAVRDFLLDKLGQEKCDFILDPKK